MNFPLLPLYLRGRVLQLLSLINPKKSDPNINITGTDENYIFTAGYKLAEGRNFTLDEVQQGKHMVIIGEEVQKKRLWQNQRL